MAKQKNVSTERPTVQKAAASPAQPFLFSRQNYLVLGAGLLLVAFGFLLMMGGSQPPTEWDPNVIYGFRRITLSTIFVLLGFGVVMLSIFWKTKTDKSG